MKILLYQQILRIVSDASLPIHHRQSVALWIKEKLSANRKNNGSYPTKLAAMCITTGNYTCACTKIEPSSFVFSFHLFNFIYFVFSLQKGQLGRPIVDMPYWNAKPSPMPNIGAKYGRKATWIGASGDQTFLRIDEALINSHVLATSEIFASKHIIGTPLLEFLGTFA